MADLAFAKLEGAGNGYLAVDGRPLPADFDWSSLAGAMTDPHFGVGSDGLLVVQESESAAIRMRVFNSDGSEAEMSGNGIRLFSKFVLDRRLAELSQGRLHVETGGGLRIVTPEMASGKLVSARVAMATPSFEPGAIPLDEALLAGADPRRVSLAIGEQSFALCCLSLGNPHAVMFPEGGVDDFPLAEIAPRIQEHPLFPNRVNVEIAEVEDASTLRVRVYERGEGETLSSGTGSTASVVAAHVAGLVGDAVRVRLRGGELRVSWDGRGEAFLDGPANEVFTGYWPVP